MNRILLLVLPVLLSGCGQSVVGTEWNCQSNNPNGTTSPESYDFKKGGNFEINSGGAIFSGTYEVNGKAIAMVAQSVNNGSLTMSTNMSIDAEIISLSDHKLELQTTVRRSGNQRQSVCTR